MSIQWYPGHMHKAGKEIKEILPKIDIVIEILDARIPFSSQNPLLHAIRADKPCLKLLHKCDLADPDYTQQWQDFFETAQNVKTLATHNNQLERIRLIPGLCQKLAASDKASHVTHALVVGIPNVGKSTLINLLAGRVIAKTGNEPAVTKMLQRIEINPHFILHDSPGMLWPNLENKNSAYRLAVTGAIKDTAISHDDVALFAADYLWQHYPELLSQRYALAERPANGQELLIMIGKRRGCLRSGGLVDIDKVAKLLLTEFRSGHLGAISLETPAMMAAELTELELIRAEKAALKQQRKAQWRQKGKAMH